MKVVIQTFQKVNEEKIIQYSPVRRFSTSLRMYPTTPPSRHHGKLLSTITSTILNNDQLFAYDERIFAYRKCSHHM